MKEITYDFKLDRIKQLEEEHCEYLNFEEAMEGVNFLKAIKEVAVENYKSMESFLINKHFLVNISDEEIEDLEKSVIELKKTESQINEQIEKALTDAKHYLRMELMFYES